MKLGALALLKIFMILAVVACDSPSSTGQPDHSSSAGVDQFVDPVPEVPGVTLQGGDQGREGGHFLICHANSPVPDSRMSFETKHFEDKVLFVDYFLEIKTLEDRNKLHDFTLAENDVTRLDQITKRLLFIFRDFPEMKLKAQRMDEYSSSFMDRKGEAQWIGSSENPEEFELTEDLSIEDFDVNTQYLVQEHCRQRLFQAAVYDYTDPEREVFYYSEFFENHASLMQKSFRNVHELLRYMLRNETPQVVKLTAYFHSKEFFFAPAAEVRKSIASISQTEHTNVPFF